ncbi:DUF4012 domain-containing protein [Arthrobacter sp. UYCo732]|uniref:DUF4012 domain-containing protein n=1 Tax=Arthrobacter sp. UYCo732 TaxID=3156336 RepID=UPI003396817A
MDPKSIGLPAESTKTGAPLGMAGQKITPAVNNYNSPYSPGHRSKGKRSWRGRLVTAVVVLAGLAVVIIGGVAWLASKAQAVEFELKAVTQLVPVLRKDIEANEAAKAAATADLMRAHATSAREASQDPLWTLAAALPGVGDNFAAVSEVARTADDVTTLAITPLVQDFGSLRWDDLVPSRMGADFKALQDASPSITTAANAVKNSARRLDEIDTATLLPQVATPLELARTELESINNALEAAASVSQLAPPMMGSESARTYLLIFQNNAEARASGGIPGALATLQVHNGQLSLSDQTSATQLGVMSPPVETDLEQTQIYSSRLGKYMQDINLTPDFPTAAATAKTMWERKTGQTVDGVISIDPVALSYVLEATGPVKITQPALVALASAGLPTELTGNNIVQTLLSDVYAKINKPASQDIYFAGVAREIFSALSAGKGNAKGLIEGLTRASSEGRVLVWSGYPAEQSVIGQYALSGSVAGPSISPAQFGAYFNDGTGAKMDYHVKRTVQLVKECPQNGYEQTTVRVTSTNTAPADAATSLPAYVTGGGAFGVPAGSVQTNIVAYGPVQANVETAKLDGQPTDFAPYRHSNRPVGVIAIQLAPGESRTVDITFGKIVQHTEPNVVVTPTVQDVKDVILPTVVPQCG